MTTYFQNTAISLTLKSSICSIHYTKHDIDTFEQGVSGNAGIVEPGVFHFEPEQGVQCQPQCWQNWEDTKQIKMFGLDARKEEVWGTSPKEFLKGSYLHWKTT